MIPIPSGLTIPKKVPSFPSHPIFYLRQDPGGKRIAFHLRTSVEQTQVGGHRPGEAWGGSERGKREGTAESWRRWLTPCAAPSRPCLGPSKPSVCESQ